MLPWVGGDLNGRCTHKVWSRIVVYRRLRDFVDPGPSLSLVFLDERPESIDDDVFHCLLSMNGQPLPFSPGTAAIWDWPAFYHDGAASTAFADGHCDHRKWKDPRTTPKTISARPPPPVSPVSSATNADVVWLWERSTRPK